MHSRLANLNAKAAAAGMNLSAAHERHLVLRADRRVLDASLELEQQSIDAGHMAVAVANGERDEEVLHARERATLVRHAMNVLFNPIRNAATAVAERVMTGREFGGAKTSTEPPLYPRYAWFFRLVDACGITAGERQEFWEEEVRCVTEAACRMYSRHQSGLEMRDRALKAALKRPRQEQGPPSTLEDDVD